MGIVVKLWDGLTNALSGLGTTTDPRSYNRYQARYYTAEEIDAAHRGSWIMRKAIDKPATEMVREWRDWQAEKANIEKLEAEEKRLDLRNKVRDAEIMRGLGGAGLVLYVPDTDQMQPLNPATIKAGDLKAIHVWHRSRFNLGEMIGAWNDPWFGHPAYYEVTLQGQAGATPTRFHPSRVVAFKADRVSDITGASWHDCFWGQSKVQTIMEAIQNVDTAEGGFAALIKDARNRRLYVPGLTKRFATTESEASFTRRAQALAVGESSLGITFLDAGEATGADGKVAGGEKLEDRQMSWAGMPDIMAAYRTAAAAAADMPATVLWGISPQGMNATGDSDIALWGKTIKGRQDLDLRPCMTQIDVALIPSALGKPDDTIWYEWAPLAAQSEKDEATTFWNTMQAAQILQQTASIPDIAFSKGMQNLMSEKGWMPGLDEALSEIPEGERFPEREAPELDADGNPIDPSALQASPTSGKEADPNLAPGGAVGSGAARRRAANDARFADATPRTLYVSRKVQNTAEIAAWAKSQGITDLNDDLHVTIAYSTTPVDWIVMGNTWQGDDKGNFTIQAGGPRVVEALGNQTAVLMFASSDLGWRNREMREAGASWDFPDYQPHISLTQASVDLARVQPYAGKIVLGPEIFEEIRSDDQA
jgi:phage-related protein (TIGR01555 family)